MNKEQWIEWRRDEGTEAFFDHLLQKRDDLLGAWASGLFTAETSDGTIQRNAEALGRVNQLNELIRMDKDDFDE